MIDERIEIRGAVIDSDTHFKDTLIYDCYIDRCHITLDNCVMRGCIVVGAAIDSVGTGSEMSNNRFYSARQREQP